MGSRFCFVVSDSNPTRVLTSKTYSTLSTCLDPIPPLLLPLLPAGIKSHSLPTSFGQGSASQTRGNDPRIRAKLLHRLQTSSLLRFSAHNQSLQSIHDFHTCPLTPVVISAKKVPFRNASCFVIKTERSYPALIEKNRMRFSLTSKRASQKSLQ